MVNAQSRHLLSGFSNNCSHVGCREVEVLFEVLQTCSKEMLMTIPVACVPPNAAPEWQAKCIGSRSRELMGACPLKGFVRSGVSKTSIGAAHIGAAQPRQQRWMEGRLGALPLRRN